MGIHGVSITEGKSENTHNQKTTNFTCCQGVLIAVYCTNACTGNSLCLKCTVAAIFLKCMVWITGHFQISPPASVVTMGLNPQAAAIANGRLEIVNQILIQHLMQVAGFPIPPPAVSTVHPTKVCHARHFMHPGVGENRNALIGSTAALYIICVPQTL